MSRGRAAFGKAEGTLWHLCVPSSRCLVVSARPRGGRSELCVWREGHGVMWLPDQSPPFGEEAADPQRLKHACCLPPASCSLSLFNQSLVRIQEWIRYTVSAKDISRARTAFYISRRLFHINRWVFRWHSYVTDTEQLILSNISMPGTALPLSHCSPRKKGRAHFRGTVRPAPQGGCAGHSILALLLNAKTCDPSEKRDLDDPALSHTGGWRVDHESREGQQTTAFGPRPGCQLSMQRKFISTWPHAHSSAYCPQLVLHWNAGLSGYQSLQYLLSGPLQEKFANSWYKEMNPD